MFAKVWSIACMHMDPSWPLILATPLNHKLKHYSSLNSLADPCCCSPTFQIKMQFIIDLSQMEYGTRQINKLHDLWTRVKHAHFVSMSPSSQSHPPFPSSRSSKRTQQHLHREHKRLIFVTHSNTEFIVSMAMKELEDVFKS